MKDQRQSKCQENGETENKLLFGQKYKDALKLEECGNYGQVYSSFTKFVYLSFKLV